MRPPHPPKSPLINILYPSKQQSILMKNISKLKYIHYSFIETKGVHHLLLLLIMS